MNKILVVALMLLVAFAVPKTLYSGDGSSDTVVLTSDNLLVLNTVVNSESAGQLILKAREMDAKLSGTVSDLVGGKKQPIYLYLNTPGGDIDSGLQIIEAFKGLGRKVHTITYFAASMGFQLCQNLNDRLVLKSGTLMGHHAKGAISGDFGGVSSSLDSRYKLWLDKIRELDEQAVKRSNGKQTYKSYIESYDHELWLTGSRAVQDGYADRVVTIRCDKGLYGTSKHSASFMGIPINYEIDLCPINPDPVNVSVGELPMGMNSETAELIKNQFLSTRSTFMKTPQVMKFNASN